MSDEKPSVRITTKIPRDVHRELRVQAAREGKPFMAWLAEQLAKVASRSAPKPK